MGTKNKKLKTKAIKIVGGFVQVILILLLVGLTCLSFGTRLPFLSKLGFNFFAVTSGSMEPTLPVGSVIYAGKYKLDELKKDDIITFQVRDDKNGQISTVTHRINEVLKDEDVKQYEVEGETKEKRVVSYNFVTKGDANNTPDQRTVPSGNIIGLYQWHLPYVGYAVSFAQTSTGFLLLVILPAIILIVWELTSLIIQIKNHYQQKAEKEIEKLKKELENKDKKQPPKKKK